MGNKEVIRLQVKRQADPNSTPYIEEFEIPYRANMNVISSLMEIQNNPVNAKGEKVSPVVWESVCLEEVCGSCTMVINDRPRQACAALIDKLEQPIKIEPMSKFPVIRDLLVDRQSMFESLKKVKAWIPVDGTFDLGSGPRFPESKRQWAYELSKCMTCGCCLEACPNYNDKSSFMGPAVMSQVRLFNAHPNGAMQKERRLAEITGEGGLSACGNSQNCVEVCPKEIPLTTSLAHMNRDAVVQSFKDFFGSYK